MPTYEFKCGQCGEEFSFFLNRTIQKEDKICPKCKSPAVKQQYAGFSFWTGSHCSRNDTGSSSTWGFG